MKERPILFSGAMVRALLAGTKTQTRRVVKLPHANPLGQWEPLQWGGPTGGRTAKGETVPAQMAIGHSRTGEILVSPYGEPGERLWVRETFRGCRAYEVQGYAPSDWGNKPIWFEADGTPPGDAKAWALRARPSIHMPRWASRITLEITSVRVERLSEISEVDAAAEGVSAWAAGALSPEGQTADPSDQFRWLWGSINGDTSWFANPWVWVIEFRRLP